MFRLRLVGWVAHLHLRVVVAHNYKVWPQQYFFKSLTSLHIHSFHRCILFLMFVDHYAQAGIGSEDLGCQ